MATRMNGVWNINELRDYRSSVARGESLVRQWCDQVGMDVEPGAAAFIVADVLAWVHCRMGEDMERGKPGALMPVEVSEAASRRLVEMIDQHENEIIAAVERQEERRAEL